MPLDKIQAWSQVQEHLLRRSPAEDQRVQFLLCHRSAGRSAGKEDKHKASSHLCNSRGSHGRTRQVGKYIDPKLADPCVEPVWEGILPASSDPGECIAICSPVSGQNRRRGPLLSLLRGGE